MKEKDNTNTHVSGYVLYQMQFSMKDNLDPTKLKVRRLNYYCKDFFLNELNFYIYSRKLNWRMEITFLLTNTYSNIFINQKCRIGNGVQDFTMVITIKGIIQEHLKIQETVTCEV